MKAAVDMNDPRIMRLVLAVALPAVAGLAASAGHHAINAIFLGALGPDVLAGISLVMPLFLLVAAAGQGLGIGLATLLARHLGEGDLKAASSVATTALAATIPLGIALSIPIYLGLPDFVGALGPSDNLLAPGLDYGRLLAFGVTLGLSQAVCDFIAIAEGNSRFSMIVLIASFALNAALDPIFIFLFKLGASGAALATVVSSIAALACYLVYFARKWGTVGITAGLIRWQLLQPIARIGIPAAAASIMTGFGFLVLMREAAVQGGDTGVAATAIAIRLMTLGQLPLFGFCLGAQGVVSHAFGAGDAERLKAVIRFMLAVTIPVALLYSILLFLAAEPIAHLFTDSLQVVEEAVPWLRALFPVFPLAAFQSVLLVMLQSRGRAGLSALVGLAPQGYLLIPLLLLLPPWMGFDGVSAAPAAAAILAAVLGLFVARREWLAILPVDVPSLAGQSTLQP
ncbi:MULTISPECIES: MATE family efflux transporter [Rhizobium]|uniref:Multidrug-efflux transporter n=1 Tax=Rhizobium tropici TaxID=398 RepID=A0A329Y6A3_RHITR|nr:MULTISPECIES: MATE family efflux transporter [Rhizobium]MBB3285772.1 putative MATE family efflux protein [Rhizobium sp. BK252]MBB3400512.1 putative MATE family efflux protein [Rhizobium sp. BK289]MBB3413091.1 putative MATE family efflux protein [Rhizobium sp. BK284]MBB3480978.1 putative MATE family efflux protein [Rhizobium sp. BK347]MDK4721652.1 MATE family efflux transporter [Rhizobium sp. CNPSo 3968]